MKPATPAIIANVLITLIILATLIITGNPLVLFGIILMKDVPFYVPSEEADEEETRSIGFH